MAMRKYLLNEIRNLRVLGRCSEELVPLTIFWTGSGIEINVRASELWVEVLSDYCLYETWVDVIIDNQLSQHFMLPKGKSTLCLFRGMNTKEIKNVKFIRDTQAMSDDEYNLFQILWLATDGTFEWLNDYSLRIEFIGDSITSGEGCSGREREMDWNSACFHAFYNYTYITAMQLNADYHCICQSGWGVYCSWDGNIYKNIPDHYHQICGVINGKRNKKLGAMNKWNFSNWIPEIIVINLGTNDAISFKNQTWIDPKTNTKNFMRINEDGSFNKNDEKKISDAIISFLKIIRKYNPNSYILWAYGMMGLELKQIIYKSIYLYSNETKDNRLSFICLPEAAKYGYGSREHPGRNTHIVAAKVLTKWISSHLDICSCNIY